MPEYKLVYFNGKGRGELIRWIFIHSGVPYTDERIEMADWPARKPSIPGGKLPVLIVDGKTLPQSLAIARYAATVCGMVPKDPFESAECDAIVDTFAEIITEVYEVLFAPGDKEEQAKKYKEVVYPNIVKPALQSLEERLKNKKYFTSNKVTWADLMIAMVLTGTEKKDPQVLNGFPVVKVHVDNVCSIPKIKAWNDWNDSQPEMPF